MNIGAIIGGAAALVTLVGVGIGAEKYLASIEARFERLQTQSDRLESQLQVLLGASADNPATSGDGKGADDVPAAGRDSRITNPLDEACANLSERTARAIESDGYESSKVQALNDLIDRMGCRT